MKRGTYMELPIGKLSRKTNMDSLEGMLSHHPLVWTKYGASARETYAYLSITWNGSHYEVRIIGPCDSNERELTADEISQAYHLDASKAPCASPAIPDAIKEWNKAAWMWRWLGGVMGILKEDGVWEAWWVEEPTKPSS